MGAIEEKAGCSQTDRLCWRERQMLRPGEGKDDLSSWVGSGAIASPQDWLNTLQAPV